MEESKDYWFKRRRYGWGWVPVRWQGWAAIVVYIMILIGGSLMLADVPEHTYQKELGIYFLIVILATAGLIGVSLAKGPKPRWRWGVSEEDNPEEDY